MRTPRRFTDEEASPISLQWIHILLSLADGDRHGYGIMQEVEDRTNGAVVLWPATLYGAIKRMLRAGLIEPSTKRARPSDDSRRRYYRLTGLGRQVLAEETTRLATLVETARAKRVLRGRA